MEPASPQQTRIGFLDVLRGVAILGILPVNIVYFALPSKAADQGVYARTGADAWATYVTDGLFSFRFISIFSFLFGVGIVILKQRCDARGTSHAILMLRRLSALIAFGMLHVVLLWNGDILLVYGVLGLVCFACVRWRPWLLTSLGVAIVMVPILLSGAAAWRTPAAPEDVTRRRPIRYEPDEAASAAAHGPLPGFIDALERMHPRFETAVYRDGTYVRQMIVRLVTWLEDLFFYVIVVLPRSLGLMLIGMACARAGWILRPVESRAAFRRAAAWGLMLGVPMQVFSSMELSYAAARSQYTGYTLIQLASLFMAAGYVGLVGLICARDAGPPPWTRPLAALGRTAFSNYILQSILCTALFYSWGLGLFGLLDRAQLWLVVAGVWVVQLLVTSIYLRRFNTGPLEAVWRRLTYGRGTAIAAATRSPAGGSA